MKYHQPQGRLWAGAALLGLLLVAGSSQADLIEAFDNATIQPAGPRTGANGKAFLNIEGSANGSLASYGVADFNSASLNLGTLGSINDLTQFSLLLTEANAAFTTPGSLVFYLSENTLTNIQPGTSPLTYDAGQLPTGLGTQLDAKYQVGTGNFTTFGNTNSGTIDSFDLLPGILANSSAAAYLFNQLNAGGTIRIIVAPNDTSVAATFAGFTNSSFDGPQLLGAGPTSVPEPSSLAFAGLAAIGLGIARRHQRRQNRSV